MNAGSAATRSRSVHRAGQPALGGECRVPSEARTPAVAPDDETLAAMAKAIAHPARLTILRLLADRQTCVTGDVVAELPLAQSTVSEHLRILRDAGLIEGEIEGPRTRYCANPTGLAVLKAGIAMLGCSERHDGEGGPS